MSDIIKIKKEYLSKLNNDLDLNSINQIKSELFGKSGKITNEFKKIGSISADERYKWSRLIFDTNRLLMDCLIANNTTC